jgi:hypothetical protein
MRAVKQVASAGIPSAAIIARQFVMQAKTIARYEGLESTTLAVYPGVILTDEDERFRANVHETLIPAIVSGLTTQSAADELGAKAATEHAPTDIVLRGSLQEILDGFTERIWSDGLPFVPPTLARVQEFIEAGRRDPAEVIGVLRPSYREATVWSVAVNGVMAGCRPEYMPVLLGIVECISEPHFRLLDAGSTPGWEPLVMLSGPAVEQLGFNCGNGVLRAGNPANSSVGRFLRLYMRNIGGLLSPPGTTDQASFGFNFNNALAENSFGSTDIGWPTLAQDEGFPAGSSTVSVQGVVTISATISSSGAKAEEHLDIIAKILRHAISYGGVFGQYNHSTVNMVLAMCPPIARAIAADGWSKDDIRRYLGDHMFMNAADVDLRAYHGSQSHSFALQKTPFGRAYVESLGLDPEAVDPATLEVPALVSVEKLAIVTAGSPGRNHSRGFIGNHIQGARVTKLIAP